MWEAQNEGFICFISFNPHLPEELALPYSPTAEGGTREVKQLALQKIRGRAGINLAPAWAPRPDGNLSLLFQALKRQSSLGLSFFNSILAHGDLRNNRLHQLSINLWHLAQRHGCADTRTMVKTLEYIKKQSKQPDMGHLTELALRLPLQTRT